MIKIYWACKACVLLCNNDAQRQFEKNDNDTLWWVDNEVLGSNPSTAVQKLDLLSPLKSSYFTEVMNNLNDDDFNENLSLIMGARKLNRCSVLNITP